jgi:hypothetical protein
MQELAAECAIEIINAQLAKLTRDQRQGFTFSRW